MAYTYRIENDEIPQNPREFWDTFGTIVFPCRKYRYLSDNDGMEEIARTVQENRDKLTEEQIEAIDYVDLKDENWIEIYQEAGLGIFAPIYLYDHSWITIRGGDVTISVDGKNTGWIFVSYDKIQEEFPDKWDLDGEIPDSLRKTINKIFKDEIENYDAYLTGQVYGWIVEEDCPHCGQSIEVDSCWGYFDRDYCEEQAKERVSRLRKKKLTEAQMEIEQAK